MAKRSKAYEAFMQRLRDEYRNAPVVEVNEASGDSFERADLRFTTCLCHGIWRVFRAGSDCMPSSHESRDAAKAYALAILMR